VRGGDPAQGALDLIRDVRDHLHRGSGIIAPPFLVDHRLIDATRGDVVRLAQGVINEPFIMPEVEVRLRPVVGDEHLAMLEGRHGARIDVDVGIELEHRDGQPALHEQTAQRRGHDPLAERGHHAAGHKDVLGGMLRAGHRGTS